MSNKSVSPNPSKIGIFLGEKCRDCDLPTKSRRAGTKSGRTKNPYSFPSGFAQKSEYDRPGKDLPTRFRVSSVLTFAVLAISVVEYSGISEMLDGKLARYLSCSAWPMASVLVFYGGYPLFRNVWKGGEDGGNAMESLMAVGVLPAYFCSLFRMIDGEELLYFDTVSILVFMFLFARLVETHVRRKVTNCVGERRSFGHGEARLASQDRMRWTGFEALLLGETLLGETLCGKSKSEDLAERWCRGLAPLVPLLAGCAIVVSYVAGNNLDESLFRAVAVSTVACPFALCVSIPLAKAAALGSGRSMGVLIRSQDALKRVKSLDTIVIAKTGGVTEGRFELIRIHAFSSDDSGILERLSSVESNSDHPLAREIVRHAEKEGVRSEKAKNFGCFEGMGVCGMYRGDEISVGNRAFMKRQGLSPVPPYLDNLAHSYERSGTTAVFFGWGSRVQGFVALEDPVGTKAGEAVAKLQKRGLEVLLVSGDSVETTRAVARELKIARFAGGLSQEQKAEAVLGMQAEGSRVGMVGDGFGDTAALIVADIGFETGLRPNMAKIASDMTLLSSDPALIDEIFDLSFRASWVSRLNLFLASAQTVIGIPLAMIGILDPLAAAIAMSIIGLPTIGATMGLLKRQKPKKEKNKGRHPAWRQFRPRLL